MSNSEIGCQATPVSGLAPEKIDRRKRQIVEMRFFGGLSQEETAEALNVSVATVRRDWRLARAWLARELKKKGE
jgi:RNA polymerase sigma factor (sigma-70 family)